MDRLEIGIGRQQQQMSAPMLKAFDRDLVIEPRHDDAAVFGRLAAMHGERVAGEEAGGAHAQAAGQGRSAPRIRSLVAVALGATGKREESINVLNGVVANKAEFIEKVEAQKLLYELNKG